MTRLSVLHLVVIASCFFGAGTANAGSSFYCDGFRSGFHKSLPNSPPPKCPPYQSSESPQRSFDRGFHDGRIYADKVKKFNW